MAIAQNERKRPRRTFTMDDEVFERLTLLAEGTDTSSRSTASRAVGWPRPRGV